MRALLIPMLLAGGVLGATLPAAAQQPTQAQASAIRQACRADYQTYCSSVPTGGKAALACLQEHLMQLSPPCHDAVHAANGGSPAAPPAAMAGTAPSRQLSPREEMAILRVDCGPDYRRLCHGVPLGGGGAMGCLRANATSLSPSCQGALGALRGPR